MSSDALSSTKGAKPRRQIGKQSSEGRAEPSAPGSAVESQRLIDEQRTRQNELERQNQELRAERTRLEAELERCTKPDAGLYDFATMSLFTLGREGAILKMNLAGANLLGREPAQLLNVPFASFVAAGDREIFHRFLDAVFAAPTKQSCEVALQAGSPTRRTVTIEAALSHDRQECRSLVIDITERKRAEEGARKSEREQRELASQLETERERLVTAQAVAKIGSWETDPATMVVIWSAETHRICETTPEQFSPTHEGFLQMVHPEDRAAVREAFTRSLEQNSPDAIKHRFLLPDGRIKFVEERWQVFRDAQGKPVRALGTCQDITERHQAETALREAEEKYRSIFDNALEGLFQNTPEGVFLSANPALARMLGFSSPEELIRERNDLERQGYAVPAQRREFQRLLEEKGVITNFEYEVKRKDGSVIWVSENVRLVRDAAGQALYYEGSVQDITQRKRAAELAREKEEAERANSAKNEFLSRMSHELRTPLNAILGFGQLLEISPVARQEHECIRHILDAGRHLLKLVDEVLDIARIESGHLEMSLEPVSIASLLHETCGIIRPLATQHEIALQNADFAGNTGGCDVHVTADRQRLKQVLLNLLSNAVKYNVKGGAVVVDCENAPTAGRLRVRVADTGPAIPPELRSRLFMPFDRLGAERSAVPGTGLGLALSRRLIEAMGGTIGFEAAEADTAADPAKFFWIELPLAANPDEMVAGTGAFGQDNWPQDERLPGGRTLLYIEDNLSNLRLIERLLARFQGVRLLTAMQGSLGLDIARQHRPDLILLDVHLPDLPGWEVLKSLRADELTGSIPVAVISADATDRQITRMTALGASAYLTKPINVHQFLQVVRRLLLGEAAPG